MGVFKAEQVCGFVYVMPAHKQALALFYYKRMYIAYGGAASCLMDHIAEVTGRIGHFRGAITHRRHSEFQLPVVVVILDQKLVEALEHIRRVLVFFRELAQPDALAVFENQAEISQDYGTKRRGVLVLLKFVTQLQ